MLNIPGPPSASAFLSAPPPQRPAPDASPSQAFARELGRAQAQDTAPPARPVAARAPATGKPTGAPSGANAGAVPAKPAAPAATQAPDSATPAPANGNAAPATAAEAAEAAKDSEAAETTEPAAEAPAATDIASMIAGLLGATTPPRVAGGARTAGDAQAMPDSGAGRTAAAAGTPLAPAGEAAMSDDGRGDAAGERKSNRVRAAATDAAPGQTPGQTSGSAPANASGTGQSPAGGAGLQTSADDAQPAWPASDGLPAATPAALAATPTTAVRHESGSAAVPSFEARLSAALGSADFAPALGQQITLLVSGGVQHARLHLNPAEMGPITVQIALDGSTAQINLAAEQPLTRQALEQAMPALAGALRDSGLTLTGGGVFEQPRDPGRDTANPWPGTRASSGDGGDGSDDDGGAAMAQATPITRTLRGAVDLIA